MSTPDPAGPGRPARLAGLGLLALAAIALVIGLISWIGGGSKPQDTAGQPPATTAGSTEPPQTTTAPPPSSEAPPPSPPNTTTSSPAATQPSQPASQSAQPPAHTQSVRVLNNSFIEKLADRAADDFKARGYNVTDVGNYSGGKIAVPTVYFRPGTDEEADARALGKDFGLRVEPRFDGIKDATPGIIVIVTKDYTPKSSK